MPTLHVLNVFTALDGSEGNPLGVFLDGAAVSAGERQAIAADLNFS
jgi:predicted PhzF superfamily epimerase YddE/YHI9